MKMTDKPETQVPHQHRYTHPGFTSKRDRNQAANEAGHPIDGHKADDAVDPMPAQPAPAIDVVNPDRRR
jgi:hypothetical protein